MEESGKRPGSPLTRFLRRRWAFIVLPLFLITTAITLLPYGIKFYAQHALMKLGAVEANIEDVDFNPFSRILIFDNITVKGPKGGTLLKAGKISLKFSYLPLVKKRIYIDRISVAETETRVERPGDGRTVVGGMHWGNSPEGAGKGGSGWSVGIGELSVSASRIDYSHNNFKSSALIDQGSLTGFKSWSPDEESTVRLSGKINGARTKISAKFSPFAPNPWLKGTIKASGLSVKPLSTLLEPRLKSFSGAIDIATAVTIDSKLGLKYSVTGSITGREINALWSEDGPGTTIKSFVWEGGYEHAQRDGASLKGNLNLTGLKHISSGEQTLALAMDNLKLMKIDASGLKKIDIEKPVAKSISVVKLSNDGAAVENEEKKLFDSGSADIHSFSLRNNDINIGSTVFYDANAFIRKTHRSQPELKDKLRALATKIAKDREGRSRAFRLSKLEVLGKSRVDYKDERLDPPYQVVLDISEATVSNIDTSRPEKPSSITASVKTGEYSIITIDGKITPFASKPSTNFKARISELDLPPLSPYTMDSYGYRIVSGHMDADLEMTMVHGDIDGKGSLVLTGVDVIPADETKLEQLRTELTVPLNTALKLLRDKNNHIRLEFPITGDISDPKVRLYGIVNKAVAKSLKKATVSYLKYYFQPYGTFITIGKFTFDKLTRLRLDPVFFLPGTVEPADGMTEYLDRVAELMKEREEVELKLCAQSVDEDLVPLGVDDPSGEVLNSLARERGSFVKDYLYTKHGVATQRLFVCDPEVDTSDDARARVEILI